MGTIQHPGLPVRKYLSGGLTLTAEQRTRIAAKVAELRNLVEGDVGTESNKGRLGLIGSMLMAYPMAGGSEEAGRARATAYLHALDDVPAWAIADAIRRWHRGEGGSKDSNYRFAPAPAELRYATMQILQPAKQVISHLEQILNALTIERAMDPAPVERTISSEGRVVSIGMRRM